MSIETMIEEWLLDPVAGPFWRGLRDKTIVLPRCARCRTWQSYAKRVCSVCAELSQLEWGAAPGGFAGEVYSVTTQHRVPPWFDLAPPYQVALVDLDNGVRFLAGVASASVEIGARVVLDARETAHGKFLPAFYRVEDGR